MEQEKKKKRLREENDEAEIITDQSFFDDHKNNNNTAKKRDLKNKEVMVVEENYNNNNNNKGCFNALDSSSNLGLGVFDFPWLKDGVMLKSEQGFFLDYCEDSFLSNLEKNQDSSFKSDHHDGIDFSDEHYGFCDTTPEGSSSMAHIPQDKLVQDLWQPFESDNNHGLDFEDSEDVDCIWSSLLNKPL